MSVVARRDAAPPWVFGLISRLIVFDKEVERPAPPPRRDAKFYILHFQFYISKIETRSGLGRISAPLAQREITCPLNNSHQNGGCVNRKSLVLTHHAIAFTQCLSGRGNFFQFFLFLSKPPLGFLTFSWRRPVWRCRAPCGSHRQEPPLRSCGRFASAAAGRCA